MGVKLRRDKIRIHFTLGGGAGEVDLRWTENYVGAGWRAEEHRPDGSWAPAPVWDAVSRDHLGSHLRYINRMRAA